MQVRIDSIRRVFLVPRTETSLFHLRFHLNLTLSSSNRTPMKTPNGMTFFAAKVSFLPKKKKFLKTISLILSSRPFLRSPKVCSQLLYMLRTHFNLYSLILSRFLLVEKDLKDLSLDELDELEDEEDELVLLKYRNQRIAEMKALAEKAKYSDVTEISAIDYVEQVNKAGPDVYVVLHLFKPGYDTYSSLIILNSILIY